MATKAIKVPFSLENLKNHKRKVPLMRGRVYLINFLFHVYSMRVLSKKTLAPEHKYAYWVLYIVSMANTIFVTWYHNTVLNNEDRSVVKRIDYAINYLIISTGYFPIYVYHAREPRTLFFVIAHWLFTLWGVFSSLLHDFAGKSKQIRVLLFILCGTFNDYIGFILFKSGRMSSFKDVIMGNTLYLLGGIVYASKSPNPVKRIFEHHELMHLLIAVGNFFTFRANFKVV